MRGRLMFLVLLLSVATSLSAQQPAGAVRKPKTAPAALSGDSIRAWPFPKKASRNRSVSQIRPARKKASAGSCRVSSPFGLMGRPSTSIKRKSPVALDGNGK